MSDSNFCPKCGSKLGKDDEFCAKCGKKINIENGSDKKSSKENKDKEIIKNTNETKEVISQEKDKKNKTSAGDIVRYIFAGLFALGALSYIVNGSFYGLFELLFAVSLCPIVYRKYLSKYVKNTKIMKVLQIILPIVLLIVFLVITPSTENINNDNQTDNQHEKQNDEQVEEKPKELSESEKMKIKISLLIDRKKAFDTGNYIQGDIPEGEYAFVKFDGSGSYYEEDDEAGNIIDNENFDSFGYVKVHAAGNLETKGVLINVDSFGDLGVSGAKEIYEILNNKKDWNQSGYYKVGTDIEPGKYILESIGSGYWAIMTGPVSSNDIEDNDNFNGRAVINVNNGQYLELHRAKLTKSE